MLVCVWVDVKWPQHKPNQFRVVVKLLVSKKVPDTVSGVWQVTHVSCHGCCYPSKLKFVAIWKKARWTSGCTHWPVLLLYHYPLQWVCNMVLSLHTLAGMVFTEKMTDWEYIITRALEKWKRANLKNKKKMQSTRQSMIKNIIFFAVTLHFCFFLEKGWESTDGRCKSMAVVPHRRQITQKVLNHMKHI